MMVFAPSLPLQLHLRAEVTCLRAHHSCRRPTQTPFPSCLRTALSLSLRPVCSISLLQELLHQVGLWEGPAPLSVSPEISSPPFHLKPLSSQGMWEGCRTNGRTEGWPLTLTTYPPRPHRLLILTIGVYLGSWGWSRG